MAGQLVSLKRSTADKLRQESRKLAQLRFRREVDGVKKNMERRDEVYRSLAMGDVIREARRTANLSYDGAPATTHIDHTKKAKASRTAKQSVDAEVKKIHLKEREIKRLMIMERQFLHRLKSTLSFEDGMHRDLEAIRKLRGKLMEIDNLD